MAGASLEVSSQINTKSEPVYNWYSGTYSNPWKSGRPPGIGMAIKWKLTETDMSNVSKDAEELDKVLEVKKCPNIKEEYEKLPKDKITTTWIGHATVLVHMDGKNILTDPVFSDACAPMKWLPKVPRRYRPVPCEIEELPRIDAVVISHNHYDHLDTDSVNRLLKTDYGKSIEWFVPLKMKSWFTGCGIEPAKVHEMNWWDESKNILKGFTFVFTPAQHWCCRNYVFDKNKTLWGSWVVISETDDSETKEKVQKSFYFGGDTGYNDISFKEIGSHYGPFDLAAIPIGAYEPRWMMKYQHVDPEDAVEIHKDIKSHKSIGIHWGTFALAYEPYLQPRTDLEKAINKAVNAEPEPHQRKVLNADEFITMVHGETLSFNIHPKAGAEKGEITSISNVSLNEKQ